jgi:hypothetical protein
MRISWSIKVLLDPGRHTETARKEYFSPPRKFWRLIADTCFPQVGESGRNDIVRVNYFQGKGHWENECPFLFLFFKRENPKHSGGNSKVQFSGIVLYLNLRSLQIVLEKPVLLTMLHISEGYIFLVGWDEKVSVKCFSGHRLCRIIGLWIRIVILFWVRYRWFYTHAWVYPFSCSCAHWNLTQILLKVCIGVRPHLPVEGIDHFLGIL